MDAGGRGLRSSKIMICFSYPQYAKKLRNFKCVDVTFPLQLLLLALEFLALSKFFWCDREPICSGKEDEVWLVGF